MIYALLVILLSTIAVFVTAHILPGVKIDGFGTALVVAVVLALINAFIRPIFLMLPVPNNAFAIGLFTLLVMGLLVMLASAIVPGFHVDNFLWALAFALVLAIINGFLNSLA